MHSDPRDCRFLRGLIELALVRKKPLVRLRYFLRRARRLVPRLRVAWVCSFSFQGNETGCGETRKCVARNGFVSEVFVVALRLAT